MKNRYEFMFFISCTNSNPNGDPDAGNTPRIDSETGHGIITDVAIKRRIRNYIDIAYKNQNNMDIIMKDGASINMQIAKVVEKAIGSIPKTRTEGNETQKATALACSLFYDVRTFGAVLSTGKNAGQIRGPVQFEFGKSVDPIMTEDITITRMCYTKKDEGFVSIEEYEKQDEEIPSDEKRTMGRKQYIPYGLYIIKGYVNASLAEQTGFTEDDLKVLFEAIMNMYEYDRSASKNSISVLSPLIIFKHIGTQHDNNLEQKEKEAMLGCAPAYKLFELVNVKLKDGIEYPRQYKDYEVFIDFSKIPTGIQIGFKDSIYGDIVWDKLPDNEEWIKQQ